MQVAAMWLFYAGHLMSSYWPKHQMFTLFNRQNHLVNLQQPTSCCRFFLTQQEVGYCTRHTWSLYVSLSTSCFFKPVMSNSVNL